MADTLVTLVVYATRPNLDGSLHIIYTIPGDVAASCSGWISKIRDGKANVPPLAHILRLLAGR